MTTTTTTTTTTTSQTFSHVAHPEDSRCSWLQVHATPEQLLSTSPTTVDRAADLPGRKLRNGADIELPAWSVLFDIEAMHHRKQRGWCHLLGLIIPEDGGELRLRWICPGMAVKMTIKAAGATHLIGGSGPNAAMVRTARWILEAEGDDARLDRWRVLKDA